MSRKISWTTKLDDGVKREVRITFDARHVKWQFKRSDEELWDYDSPPTEEDWDTLEGILYRRGRRGRQIQLYDRIRSIRQKG